MVPAAPVTFSITTVSFSVARIFSPMTRASTSLGPPAANGTMMVIGFDGNVCACADATSANNPAATAASVLMPILSRLPSMSLLRLDAGGFDDRMPLFDFGLVIGVERFRRLLIDRRDVLAQLNQPLARHRIGHRLARCGI